MNRTTNNVGAAPGSRLRGNDWDALDKLPRDLRRALWDGVLDWSTLQVRYDFKKLLKSGYSEQEAVAIVTRDIRRGDADEIEELSHYWPSRFGPYPHLAACASLQSYERTTRV
jgi:hypothetical protein